MKYRRLDENMDYTFGKGNDNFWIDVPDAPGQAVLTRLKLELGQWFLDLEDGTPWNTRVLGKYTGNTRDPVIRARVLNTEGVRFLIAYSSHFDPETREWGVDMTIDTNYGRSRPIRTSF